MTSADPAGWSRRTRLVALSTVVCVCVAGAGAYLAVERARAQERVESAPPVATTDLASVLSVPHVVFRTTALGQDYGRVSVVPLGDPDGPRAVTDVECERVYSAADRYVCLSAERGLVTTYAARVLDYEFDAVEELPLTGFPSRARLSPDGEVASTTSFVSGHSYAQAGFSTATVVTDVATEASSNLEDFTFVVDGQVNTAVDRNFWGVTFARDGDTFFATGATAGITYLVRGSLSDRTLETLQMDAECPSLSPDGGTVVYKKRQDRAPGDWRLAAYDLATGVETLLGETRSVDDQVEWLDQDHVVYGLNRAGSEAAVSDVWSLPVDGSGGGVLMIPGAWSPAVIR